MLKGTLQKKQRGLASWKTRDLLVTAAIGIVFGLVLVAATGLNTLLMASLTPQIGMILVVPIYVVAGQMALYIVRKPGAAILSEFVSSLVMMPLTIYGFTTIPFRLLEGALYEIPFVATRYRRWGWLTLILSSGFAQLVGFTIGMLSYGGFNLAPGTIGVLYVADFIAAAVGSVLTKLLADTIARTGVLSSLAVGQKAMEEV